MDKEHLIELISSSLITEAKNIKTYESRSDIKSYLLKLNLYQLRTMSKEFIL